MVVNGVECVTDVLQRNNRQRLIQQLILKHLRRLRLGRIARSVAMVRCHNQVLKIKVEAVCNLEFIVDPSLRVEVAGPTITDYHHPLDRTSLLPERGHERFDRG